MIPRFCWKACLGALVCLCLVAGPAQGAAQFTNFLTVDCTGTSAAPVLPSISAAVSAATPGTWIWVNAGSTCAESVTVNRLTNIAIASTMWESTFNLSGNLTITGSQGVLVQGMAVTNPYGGDGINVNNSTDVEFDFAASVNNGGMGLNISSSQVTIGDYGTFSNNGNYGINAGDNSALSIVGWSGAQGTPVDISNNMGFGINLDRSVSNALGNMTITNTRATPGGAFPNGFGINEFGGAKSVMIALFGPLTIASNAGGGVSIQESSELSFGGLLSYAPYPVNIQGNGPFGIAADYGAQLTMYSGVQVTGHSTAGISLYGNSQGAIYGASDLIANNGTGIDSHRAGILVEQGSQAYVANQVIQNNGGPGILALAHATLDVEGSTFSSNAAGAIVCDGSTALQTDLPAAVLGAASKCNVGVGPGGRHHEGSALNFSVPDWRSVKARAMKLHHFAMAHLLRAGTPAK